MEGIVRKEDGQLVVARWKKRTPQNDDASALYDIQPLQLHDRGPAMQPEWTRCPAAESELVNDDSRFFVKKPSLLDYTDSDLSARIAREIAVCEGLRGHPHPNLATYHGCCVSANGHVDGLCFQRYRVSLLELCNPGRLNKHAFVARGGQRSKLTVAVTGGSSTVQLHSGHLDGLLAGIRNLHSLGLVHNDINPANIMVDGFDRNDGGSNGGKSTTPPVTLVLVDFDSCRPTGTSLRETKTRRTHGWHDATVATAQADSDLNALAEVRAWLFGDITQLRWE